MKSKGLLIIVSGFSGAGKGTIVNRLLSKGSEVSLSISATTRQRRNHEVHGEHYYFLSKEDFEEMIRNDELYEYAKYLDNYYGTPKKYVEEQLSKGEDVILEIEMQGALQVKEAYEEAVMVFIVAPHVKDVKRRLESRNTESEEVIRHRLEKAYEESEHIESYDYIIVNDVLDEAVDELIGIIRTEHLREFRNKKLIGDLKLEFEDLLRGEQ